MKAELEFNTQVQSTVEPQLSGLGVNSPDNRKSENSEYPRIFQVMGANQNVRKLLSTDLVNTNN